MRQNDTITCAITPPGGCAVPNTATVFRSVNQFCAKNATFVSVDQPCGATPGPVIPSPCCDDDVDGLSPAMVYETDHQPGAVYGAQEAIRKGTLFQELYMPMAGECADAQGARLCPGQADAFAAWEMRLYLDTHPRDRQALEQFRQYARKAGKASYATAFITERDCADRWHWVDAPWPWEFNEKCE